MELTEGNVLRDGPLERVCQSPPHETLVRVEAVGDQAARYRVTWTPLYDRDPPFVIEFVSFGSVRGHVGALADARVWRQANDGL